MKRMPRIKKKPAVQKKKKAVTCSLAIHVSFNHARIVW